MLTQRDSLFVSTFGDYLLSHSLSSVVLGEFSLVKVIEVGVLHGHAAGDALVWLQGHHASQKIQTVLIQILRML